MPGPAYHQTSGKGWISEFDGSSAAKSCSRKLSGRQIQQCQSFSVIERSGEKYFGTFIETKPERSKTQPGLVTRARWKDRRSITAVLMLASTRSQLRLAIASTLPIKTSAEGACFAVRIAESKWVSQATTVLASKNPEASERMPEPEPTSRTTAPGACVPGQRSSAE